MLSYVIQIDVYSLHIRQFYVVTAPSTLEAKKLTRKKFKANYSKLLTILASNIDIKVVCASAEEPQLIYSVQ